MCRRHVEGPQADWVPLWKGSGVVGRGAEEESDFSLVVDVLCPNPHCLFRDENLWHARARRQRQFHQTCGSSACLTARRCSLVLLPEKTNKRRRLVLVDPSVDPTSWTRSHLQLLLLNNHYRQHR